MLRLGVAMLLVFSAGAPDDGSALRARLVAAARAQIGRTVRYDASYQRLAYPRGDVPLDRGVCSDVVIRALREVGVDLQVELHEDLARHFDAYPNLWQMTAPDPNIDHRRVPMLETFFRRRGLERPASRDPGDYLPGDFVTWRLPGNLPHIGLVSDRKTPDGRPLVLHNIGEGTREEDALFAWPPTAHFRWFDVLASATPATYQVHDDTQTFWRFWDHAKDLPEAAQLRLLQREVVQKRPDIYAASVIGLDPAKPYSSELAARWPKFLAFAGPSLPLARKLSSSIGRDLPKYDARFRKTFPDFAYTGDVYFTVSLGGFDGAVREVNGRTALLFGVDIIAAVYGAEAYPEAFFDHELFHIYHQQFPDPALEGTLARELWREGLAEYVAEQLNPHATEVVLFGLPRSTPARVRDELPALAAELRGRLRSKSPDDYRRWFLGSAEGQEPPSRAGYTLGYLVVKAIAGQRTLAELARLRGPELLAEIDAALAKLGAR
jgi:uncharacterized protein YijF (DUF1287 family)